MSTSDNSNNKTFNPLNVIGGPIGWLDEVGFETATKPVSEAATGLWEAVSGLVTENIVASETKDKSNGALSANGSIEFKKAQAEKDKKQEETDRKKLFYQALKEDQNRAEATKEKLLTEEEINDIVTSLPTEQKNQLLHYQASYRDRSTYQRAELRKKMIEEQKRAADQKKEAAIPSPAKQANAMDTAFEGGSGKSGSGSANFSSTGGGAG